VVEVKWLLIIDSKLSSNSNFYTYTRRRRNFIDETVA